MLNIHTQCANRPFCVTVISILSMKFTMVATVSISLMEVEAVLVRAGNGDWVTLKSLEAAIAAAMI